MNKELRMQDAFAAFDGSKLTVGNSFFERTIDLSKGYPVTSSLKVRGVEFADAEKAECDISLYGLNFAHRTVTEFSVGDVVFTPCENDDFDAPHLKVELFFKEDIQQAYFCRIFRIYCNMPACSVQNTASSGSIPNTYWTYRDELSLADSRFPDSFRESCVDSFAFSKDTNAVKSVAFRGRTDYHNALVDEYEVKDNAGKYNGNLMLLAAKNSSLLMVQEAPPSVERRDFEKYDFRLENNTFFSCCWGAAPSEITPNRKFTSYRNTMLFMDENDNLTTALHSYLAKRFPMKKHEAAILVNPWGCGKFPEYTSEQFLLEEIAAAGKLGAEIYQIDDSWQLGDGLHELTTYNRAVTMDFWKTSPTRLAGGFEPVKAVAEKSNIKLGLWCAPTYMNMYRDHSEFADMLLDYHRKYDFATVKIDGVRLQSIEAQENLESMLRKVRTETDKKVFFNLDTTNGQRPGYFYFLEYGNIFLENRYTYGSNATEYTPEKTLRNLWQLSRYVRPQTLQIEIPCPSDIPSDKTFERDPRNYSFDYWCAVALFANILIWTAPSKIDEKYSKTLQEMISLHKSLREKFFDSIISPIGNIPDGKSFTGFASSAGLCLIFRELDCPESEFELPSNGKVIAGSGSVSGKTLTMDKGSWCVIELQ